MNNDIQFEDRVSRSRSKHEGESSASLCDRFSLTRVQSQRQLPTDHDCAVPTREYQLDQSSPLPATAAADLVLEVQRQKQPQRLQVLTGHTISGTSWRPLDQRVVLCNSIHVILKNDRGKRSREKHNRTPAPVSRFSIGSFLLDRSTWLFVVGGFTLLYGTAGMQYSRLNHIENARVHPVFHPWAIVAGIALIVPSYKMPRRDGRS